MLEILATLAAYLVLLFVMLLLAVACLLLAVVLYAGAVGFWAEITNPSEDDP